MGRSDKLILLAFFVVALVTIAAGIYGWQMLGPVSLSLHGWLAIAAGVFFSFLLGGGLMALSFYSSRRGYDEEVVKTDLFGRPRR